MSRVLFAEEAASIIPLSWHPLSSLGTLLIEVQSQEESGFAQRMLTYHYRLLDRYKRPVVSMAVLGDERASWRPSQYTSALWGCSLTFQYPIAKLLDYGARRSELETAINPFATVVPAHLTAQETRRNPRERADAKFALIRRGCCALIGVVTQGAMPCSLKPNIAL